MNWEECIDNACAGLESALDGHPVDGPRLEAMARQTLAGISHGDLSAWKAALGALPKVESSWKVEGPAPRLGVPVKDHAGLEQKLMAFHPWRKGPLELGGVYLDTEWRSDWKWDRMRKQLDLTDHVILDVGCGNGYFGWRMLDAGARCVVGLDPTALFVMQWLVQRHCSGPAPNYLLPLRDTDWPEALSGFDTVSSMGVLYHRREPADHLQRLYGALAPGGQLILETLVMRDGPTLYPEGRYARMRNVHEVPDLESLLGQVIEAGFHSPELIDVTATTREEQRSTPWMRFESLGECLDADDPTRTIEGYPAPVRATVLAQRPS